MLEPAKAYKALCDAGVNNPTELTTCLNEKGEFIGLDGEVIKF